MVIYYTENLHRDDRKRALETALHDYCGRRGIVYNPDGKGQSRFIFDKTENGKPYLRGTARKRPNDGADLSEYENWQCDTVCFSISHSGRFWACGVYSGELGIDIEDMAYRKKTDSLMRIAKRFFTDVEAAYVKNAEDFFSVWTRKEAYVKHKGTGIGKGFQSFSTVGNDNRLVDKIEGSEGEDTVYIGEIPFFRTLDSLIDQVRGKLNEKELQAVCAYCADKRIAYNEVEIVCIDKDKIREID